VGFDLGAEMIKSGQLVLIENQDELNLLAEVTGSLALDCLHIDEPYVAYMDEVLIVIPLKQIDETHFLRGIKPTLFRKWYKKIKEIGR